MYKHLFVPIILTSVTFVFAQNKEYSCSHVKSKEVTAKTPTLSPGQNAETTKYDVTFYELNLNMSNTTTFISGNGVMKGKAVVATDSILLELYKTLTIDSVYLNGVITPFSRVASVLKVPVNLTAGNEFEITTFYQGLPPSAATNPLGGAGLSNATANNYNAKVTWSLSEPFSAFEWFPVKQDLRDKADSCAINITIDNSLKAGSNGTLDSIVDHGNGFSTYHWYHRHPISYYLISVAVSDYVEYNVYAFPGTPEEIFIQNYIYSNPVALQDFQADIDETADFIELFSDLFGMYPFANEKYGHCMAPIGGGMEHQTMTTQGSFSKMLTSHELAHQWWGDYVTCASWADVWLNEGFASYSEYLVYENLYPGLASGDMNQRHSSIMSQPGGSVWVADSTNDAAIFSSRLTYNKGAAIIHTLRYIINDDSLFFKGLKTYLETYKNNTATVLDMKLILENETGVNLDDFYDQWLFGEGYPSYSVNWKKENDNLILNIKHVSSTSTTPLFTNPIDLKISRVGLSDTIIRVPISSNDEYLYIPNFPNIKKIVRTDPDNWIIDKVGPIKEDTSLHLSTIEKQQVSKLKLFPIPTSDFLNIEGAPDESYTAEIIDLRGVLIESFTFKGSYKLAVNEYKEGAYLIRIINNTNHAVLHRFFKL